MDAGQAEVWVEVVGHASGAEAVFDRTWEVNPGRVRRSTSREEFGSMTGKRKDLKGHAQQHTRSSCPQETMVRCARGWSS